MSSYGTNSALPVNDGLVWRRARYCYTGECVEVARQDGIILMRDSKDPQGGVVRISDDDWTSLVSDIKAGALDDLNGT